MKVSDNLARARDYLIEHGWAQLTLQATDGRVCALGALDCAGIDIGRGFETDCLQDAALEKAGSDISLASPVASVADFNDGFAKSESEIVDLYDRAIIIAKEAEAS